MDICQLADILGADIANLGAHTDVTTGYCGDFLSNVISKAESGTCWFTVMNNINVLAVATLAEIGAIVLCEGVKTDDLFLAKAKEEKLNILTTDLSVFCASARYAKALL